MSQPIAIITGASSGIGKATAILLARNRFKLVLASRNIDSMQALKDEYKDQIVLSSVDVQDTNQTEALIDTCVQHFGGINVLINNAGLGYIAPLEEGKLTDWQEMINVNITGVLNCFHFALPHLLKSQGIVINLSSVAAHEVFPNSVIYCLTKHAIDAFAIGVRKEFRERLRVCNISPGAVRTAFLETSDHNEAAENMRSYLLNSDILESHDIAEVILDVLKKPKHVVINEVIVRPNL